MVKSNSRRKGGHQPPIGGPKVEAINAAQSRERKETRQKKIKKCPRCSITPRGKHDNCMGKESCPQNLVKSRGSADFKRKEFAPLHTFVCPMAQRLTNYPKQNHFTDTSIQKDA